MNRESGMLLYPLVLFMTIGMGAAFLLIPSMDREDVIEHQRLLTEQARAAAEGALALALHTSEDVADLKLGRATGTATWETVDRVCKVTATAEVPSLRDAKVTFTTTWPR